MGETIRNARTVGKEHVSIAVGQFWRFAEEDTPIPAEVIRAVRVGVPWRLGSALTSRERARVIAQNTYTVVQELARKDDRRSVKEKVLGREETRACLALVIYAAGLNVYQLTKIFAPGAIGMVDTLVDRATTRKDEIKELFKFAPAIISQGR